jgi:hypothetical protein
MRPKLYAAESKTSSRLAALVQLKKEAIRLVKCIGKTAKPTRHFLRSTLTLMHVPLLSEKM